MNRVGELGQGESVWLGWLLYAALTAFAPLGRGARRDGPRRGRGGRMPARCRTRAGTRGLGRRLVPARLFRRRHAAGLGHQRRNAGSTPSRNPGRRSRAPATPTGRRAPWRRSKRKLIRPQEQLALLFTPPSTKRRSIPATSRAIRPASAKTAANTPMPRCGRSWRSPILGEGDKAAALFALLNPINHARTRADVHRYKVEPYVVAADVYAVATCRAWRLDLVHRLGRMDAARRRREHSRAAHAG